MMQGTIPPVPPLPDPNPLLYMHGDAPQLIVLIVLAGIAATTIILWPIMRAFARRLEAKAGPDPALKAELDEMHHRLAEMEPLQARLAELEERLDFAERLLAQPQTSARLGAPTEGNAR